MFHKRHFFNPEHGLGKVVVLDDTKEDATLTQSQKEMGKLWMIVKKVQYYQHDSCLKNQELEVQPEDSKVPQIKSNAFYLKGGEKFKLGRVIMRVVEVNIEDPNR